MKSVTEKLLRKLNDIKEIIYKTYGVDKCTDFMVSKNYFRNYFWNKISHFLSKNLNLL